MKTITDLQSSLLELEKELKRLFTKQETTKNENKRARKINQEMKELRLYVAYLQSNPTEQALQIQLGIVLAEMKAANNAKTRRVYKKGEWEREYSIAKLRKQKKTVAFLLS